MSKTITTLADLTQDDRNANAGTARGREMVERSLHRLGAGRSILVDRNGKIIAGNKTHEAAAAIGLDAPLVVQSDGTRLVVVQRTDLDMDEDTAARELAIADNRAAETGLEWDTDVLASLGESIDLSQFWTHTELENMLGEEVNPEDLWKGMPDFEQESSGKLRSITVHFRTKEAVAIFGQAIGQTITDQTRSIFYPKEERANFMAHRVQDES